MKQLDFDGNAHSINTLSPAAALLEDCRRNAHEIRYHPPSSLRYQQAARFFATLKCPTRQRRARTIQLESLKTVVLDAEAEETRKAQCRGLQ